MRLLKIFSIFIILFLTASAASAAYCSGEGKCHRHFPNHYRYEPCESCRETATADEAEDAAVPPDEVQPVVPTDAAGTTTVKLCSNNVCTVGGNGEVITLTNYNNAVDPTYDQLIEFLKADKTDERPYTSTYVCSDFAKTLHDNAEKNGIRAGWIGSRSCNHAFNVFQTTDKGTVYIDCTGVPGGATLQDKQLNVEVGQPLTGKYLFRSGTVQMGCTLANLLIYW
ncbi:hypothetical protein SAMN02910340_02544 [Methanosarcina thermophila]|jgi:hypothetical protein|uniref:Uncharacterized protein n=3 Tax=Methanosarcina thermophila TaxID=2210 RepID=A0A0E3HA35_METTE|nr:hypothetical protein [Methanosarcina thermophila]AKB14194.1 hypothetical protein MSTHT_2436 [Methanosarcina thermophila TM-1]AKB15164.1 hypothetical protein MSTHC_0846 [Methanosarcina thermophila CHTI-55]ALK05392.1 MAG: hypothetical protein AAY43_06360 [Methanosarcina sp. 795]SFT82067.1 hypothetical protein SAMN02910340_02544 [Methanosarcina thermophila]